MVDDLDGVLILGVEGVAIAEGLMPRTDPRPVVAG